MDPIPCAVSNKVFSPNRDSTGSDHFPGVMIINDCKKHGSVRVVFVAPSPADSVVMYGRNVPIEVFQNFVCQIINIG